MEHRLPSSSSSQVQSSVPPSIPPTLNDSKPQKKRRRPALACEQCRKRKIRCDRNVPCHHCIKSKIPDCSYAPTHIPASWAKKATGGGRQQVAPDVVPSFIRDQQESQPQPQPQPRDSTEDSVDSQPRDLSVSEFIVANAPLYQPVPAFTASRASSVPDNASGASRDVDWVISRVHYLEEKLAQVVNLSDDPPGFTSPTTHSTAAITATVSKTRYFGRSHWMNYASMVSASTRNVSFSKFPAANRARSSRYR